VSGYLVGSAAFKAVVTSDPREAGSIPVHLRDLHKKPLTSGNMSGASPFPWERLSERNTLKHPVGNLSRGADAGQGKNYSRLTLTGGHSGTFQPRPEHWNISPEDLSPWTIL
jgi:hypothetical protein